MSVKIKGDQILNLSYSCLDLIAENPHTNFPFGVSLKELFDKTESAVLDGCALVDIEYEIPSYDRVNQRIEANEPIVKDGRCVVSYSIKTRTPEEIQSDIDSLITQG